MVSASHNPWHDNGIKLFAPGGRKLDDDAQREIEQRLADAGDGAAGVGVETPATDAEGPGTATWSAADTFRP